MGYSQDLLKYFRVLLRYIHITFVKDSYSHIVLKKARVKGTQYAILTLFGLKTDFNNILSIVISLDTTDTFRITVLNVVVTPSGSFDLGEIFSRGSQLVGILNYKLSELRLLDKTTV